LGLAKEFGALTEVLAKSLVLERQFINLFLQLIVLSSSEISILVTFENIDLPLKLVIFSIKKVNLTLQFLNAFLIFLVLILQVELLQILSRCVKFMQPQNLLVTHLYLLSELSSKALLIDHFLL